MTDHTTASLLVELLTEELPPKALARLSEAFSQGIAERLAARGLVADATSATQASFEAFATPRRLAVVVRHVRGVAPSREIREKVLPVSVALNAQGEPTPPLAKKLAALGFPDLTIDKLERASDGKADAFFLSYTAPGATLAEGLQAALDETLAKLPIPKVMKYQRPNGDDVQFVRPAHKLIALHGDAVVPVSALGLSAGRQTAGHRFLSKGVFDIAQADTYANQLNDEGRVVASYAARREQIRHALLAQAGADQVVMPDALLDEVNSLVEWPVVYACAFDEAFLAVPQECLILTMQTNQKYFALTDASGKLRSRFLIVSNIATDTPREITEGNERVVRPRLADAKFFFEQDKKKTLADRVPLLANVVYHNKLGSQLERVRRIESIAASIAPLMHADLALAKRAAQLAKADQLTDMVGEFPELQGTMGRYYALHDGEPADVAQACAEHYQPRFAGDALPSTQTGTIVALADKLETLTGIWGIGLAPTGEKDPFALRRHALGVLRILLEKGLPLDIKQLLQLSYAQFATQPHVSDSVDAIYAFLLDRLRGLLRERGYTANEIEAVVSQQPVRIDDIVARIDAVRAFATLPEADALAAANKRISNILKKSDDVAAGAPLTVDAALLGEAAERDLFDKLAHVAPVVQTQLAAREYAGALTALASLRTPVDTFFNDVMVNAEDPGLRANRLALLSQLHAQMNCVADISKLAA
ncbi:glycine--tRNA ligase subunit beta [Pararobbsia silviterrae]|uniref:Glycine--tRNA ligase beta subunit n=1 Tax=Pararobbsia silviterrae TaxID=1792498 RepID=A0A494YFY0_9BURK|nr:glycine--tRNA ligase subunit beta [Pararobbsia silviterrae]RKP58947.1 glycine--tRNA ligase subunit beta [Pararobbsia silviterrae]